MLFARRKSICDPNSDKDIPYKQTLSQIIKDQGIRFVLDIHGANNKQPFGMALGTMHGRSCPSQKEIIIRELEQSGFSASNVKGLDFLDIDITFLAEGPPDREPITRFVWETLQIPDAQIELNAALRIVRRRPDASTKESFTGDQHRIERALDAFVRIVRAVANTVS